MLLCAAAAAHPIEAPADTSPQRSLAGVAAATAPLDGASQLQRPPGSWRRPSVHQEVSKASGSGWGLLTRRGLRKTAAATGVPGGSTWASPAWVPDMGWLTILWLQRPRPAGASPTAGTPQMLADAYADSYPRSAARSDPPRQAAAASSAATKGMQPALPQPTGVQLKDPGDPDPTIPIPAAVEPAPASKRAGAGAAAPRSTTNSAPAPAGAPSRKQPAPAPSTSSSTAAARPAGLHGSVPAGVWQGRNRVVAGAPGAAAVSGLTGPPPFMLTQPGATKTLHIGCLSERETMPKDVPDLTYQAMKLAIQDFAPKLLPNLNIKFTCYETKCGDIAAPFAMQLLAQQDALAVVASTCSTDAVAAAGAAGAAQMPLISASSSSPQLSGMPFFARTVPSNRYAGAVAAKLARSMGLNSVGVVVEDNAYAQGVSFYFMAAFSAYGGTLPEVYTFQPGTGDAKAALALMQKAKAGTPQGLDGVFVAVTSRTMYTDFLRAIDKSTLDVPVLSAGGAAHSTEIVQALKDNLGVLRRVTLVIDGPGPEEFRARLKAAVGNREALDASSDTGQAYDAMVTLLKAYAAAAEPKSGVEVFKQIPKQRFQGVTGPVEFDSRGDLTPHNSTFFRAKHDPKTGEVQFGPPLPVPNSDVAD